MRIRNVKLILVLLLFGLALMVIGATRMNLGDQGGLSVPASTSASWITGLFGLGLVAAAAFLLGKRSLEALPSQAANPRDETERPFRTMAILLGAVVAVAAVTFGSFMLRSRAPDSASFQTPARDPVARDGSAPAPPPAMPKSYQP